MALGKSTDTVDAWQEVAQNTVIEGATKDLTGAYQVTLHIDVALTSTTATTNGLRVIIQISSAASGDLNWTDLTSFGVLAGLTATKASVANTLTAGEASVISVNALGGFTTEGIFVYIDDGASSEIVFEKSQSATAISIIDNVVYGHVSTTPLYVVSGVAGSSQGGAMTISVNIPDTANRVRVLYDNTQDSAGSTVDVRCNLSKITAI